MRNWLLLSCSLTILVIFGNFSVINPLAAVMGRSHSSVGFLFQRTVSINQRTCTCPNTFSCSCCQSVTILLRGIERNFCVNFTYAQTGLTMTITMGANIIRYVSIIDYRAFKVCTSIPDCFHSLACVDVVELTQFPRSLTICMQLDIVSKTKNWLINYNCISVSTLNSTTTNATTTNTTTTNATTTNTTTTNATTTNITATTNTTAMPGGNMPAGQMPAGLIPAGQIPAGQMPAGQMPAGQMPAGQMMTGQMPAGQMPAGQMPVGQMPMGQFPAGQMPTGQMPQGPVSIADLASRQLPSDQFSNGQMPPVQMVSVVGSQRVVLRSTNRVPGFLNWILSKKSMPESRMVNNRLNIRGLKPVRNSRSINILPINEISKDILEEEGRKVHGTNPSSNTPIKSESWDQFYSRKVISQNNLPTRLNRLTKRDINERRNPGMEMQVIDRSRKNRLSKMIGDGPRNRFKTSVNHPASRNPRIVNQDTISIPMSNLAIRNVLIMESTTSNNALTPVRNGSQTESARPQPIPDLPINRFPALSPVLVVQDAPSMGVPVLPDFLNNYDNRTSSFPDRMPPSFGIATRIGPINNDQSPMSFDRSVEELETVGPITQLHPNSKISEMTTTDSTDGTIIFPE